MENHMLIFGLGYTASYLAENLRSEGWKVTGVKRNEAEGIISFDDAVAVNEAINSATHILSSVPSDREDGDPVLDVYGDALAKAPACWIGYLSSTGVYGDTGGAWVDESAKISGRRLGRNKADLAWQALRDDVRVFRLPGIYGPGRSVLDRIRQGKAHRIDLPDQVFSRVHVDDIVSGIIASFGGPPGIYNLADDYPCSQNELIEFACALLGCETPPIQSVQEAQLSPMALAFYAENRRVSNQKAKRLLKWRPYCSHYKQGLRKLYEVNSPETH